MNITMDNVLSTRYREITEQNRPIFLINKYRSILKASIAVEIVTFLITLTDLLVAGNMIGDDQLVAVGMVAPLLPVEWFFAATICSGTLLSIMNISGDTTGKMRMISTVRDCSWLSLPV